ncbi:MAG: family 78 glycoside hydrolase catalytic domain [Clostridia bacterium]|nr:family 78 glycoside hydrolase catalytic domain [Clostridia bacterium]
MKKQFIRATEEFASFEKGVNAPHIRKSFSLDFVPEKATIDISGHGFYVLFVNGKDITKGHLAPYISNLDHYIYYDSYDVSSYLKKGENVIGVMLGNGFMNPFGGSVWDFDKVAWKNAPCLALEFSAEGEGKALSFDADESFKCHPSPIIFDELRMGEHFDANLEIDGWNMPGFDDSKWNNALIAPTPRGKMEKCEAEPVCVQYELKPTKFYKVDGGYIYDFGENNAGVCRLNLKNAAKGQRVELWHAELLKEDGSLDISSTIFDRPTTQFYKEYSQKDLYIAKGEGEEIYTPSFTYHGFRYVYVTGITDEQATGELLTYIVMSTGFSEMGGFDCSSETVKTLFEMAKRSDRSNFYYFPTDCPHREKNGWTGDASISAPHMTYLYDTGKSYTEWLKNIRAAQTEDGRIPGIVPTGDWGFAWGNGPAWDSVLFNLPYELYIKRGNTDIIRENKSAMMRYLTYIMGRRSEDGTIAVGLGDWVPVGKGADQYDAPLALTDTLMVMKSAHQASVMFDAIEATFEADYARSIEEDLRNTLRDTMIDYETMTVKGSCQSSQALGIYYGLFTEEEKDEAFSRLLEFLHKKDDRFDVGFLGLSVIFDVLSDFGEGNLAYRLITQDGYPSYAHLIENGETTIPEWFKPDADRLYSHNHHFLCDFTRWFIERVAGLKVIDSENVLIQPDFIDGLDYASAYYDLPSGRVSVSWKRENSKVKVSYKAPAGVSVTEV